MKLLPILTLYKLGVGVAIACAMITCNAQVLGTLWKLRVMDLKHKVQVEGTIRFAKEFETESCMAGQWKRVVVEARAISNEKFFPLTEPLAYEIRQGEITFGRARVCDGYLFLIGNIDNIKIQGVYHVPGPGYNQKLGYFSLVKIR